MKWCFQGKWLNLRDQVHLFEATIKLDLERQFESPAKLSEYLSKSIFIVSIGSNDYNNYLEPEIYDTSRRYNPQAFAKLLTDVLSQQFQRLYKLGARKVVMFELGPVGCVLSITRRCNHTGQCDEDVNHLIHLFNAKLRTTPTSLTSTLQASTFILGHVNGLGYDAIINPTKYGITDSRNPCCITWANGTSSCIPGLMPCMKIDKHYFWDGYHLTEPIYSFLGTNCINDNSFCIPMSIKQLVRI